MKRLFILAITLLMVAGLMLTWQVKFFNGGSSGSSNSDKFFRRLGGNSADSENRDAHLGTKSKIRSLRRKPTVEETRKLVRETIIPVVDLPAQAMEERLTEINRLIRECGIGKDQLQLVIDEEGAAPDRPPLAGLICWGPLRVRNIPLFQLLLYTVDNFAFRYEIVAGRVDFFWRDSIREKRSEDHTIESVDPGDPFADPRADGQGTDEKEAVDAADPFAEANGEK